jgi:hypothetical protein
MGMKCVPFSIETNFCSLVGRQHVLHDLWGGGQVFGAGEDQGRFAECFGFLDDVEAGHRAPSGRPFFDARGAHALAGVAYAPGVDGDGFR